MSDRIVVDPNVLLGEPHVKGTERPVYMVVEFADAGLSPEEIVAAYPELTVEDVKAALEYHAKHGKG
jgi:uncharacterized protein (DUF433 family)